MYRFSKPGSGFDEIFHHFLKEARVSRLWIYHKSGAKGRRWFTPEEFRAAFGEIRINHSEVEKFRAEFVLKDPNDGIKELLEHQVKVSEATKLFIHRVAEYERSKKAGHR
ncbi:MAG TPA: hypothetical protein VGD90_07145 [Sphingobacteriaceae bacterium]